jgi:hypothetical protein
MTDETPGRRRFQDVGRAVQGCPGGDLLLSGPRAIGFARRARRPALLPDGDASAVPVAPPGMAFTTAVMIDEIVLALMRVGRLNPSSSQIERIGDEVQRAVRLFTNKGWLDDPLSFHASPPPPTDVRVRRGHVNGSNYERISFESGYDPDPGIPGSDRWLSQERNRSAWAWVLRSSSGQPAPWLVTLHAFGMGWPSDMRALGSFRYRARGINVIHPIFPLHGPRRCGRRNGDGVITLDAMANVHGLAQAIWDIRRCVLWAREQGATHVGVNGVSLGAYTAALLAGIVDDLACVVAGIPPVELVALLQRSMPRVARPAVRTGGLLGGDAKAVHRVVSPLAFAPRVPHDRRFIYAGIGDRMATAQQAEVLWRHWDRPAVLWFASSHVGHMWTSDVRRFARRAVYCSLLGPPKDVEREDQ